MCVNMAPLREFNKDAPADDAANVVETHLYDEVVFAWARASEHVVQVCCAALLVCGRRQPQTTRVGVCCLEPCGFEPTWRDYILMILYYGSW